MYFITISEMMGTDGEKIAREVAKKVGYPYYGKEELFNAAEEAGLLSDVQKLELKSPSLLEKYFSDKPRIYLDRFQSVIYDVAEKGNAVFFGKGSQLLLNSFECALHVLVIGGMEKRIKRVMEENKVGREVAEKIIHTSDHDKRGFLRYAFDREWLDPHLYDLVLNTDILGKDSAVNLTVVAAKSEEIKSCGMDAVKELGKLSLYRKVESTLLEAGILHQHLFFAIEDIDSVRLFGVVNSSEDKREIEKMLKKIKEIKNIKNELVVVTGSIGGA
jgi:cytidylate kinase